MSGLDNIEFASLTDVGIRRSHNQDNYAVLPANDGQQWRERGHLFLVADGMGAHAVGELASKLAVDGIPHIYSKHAQEGSAAALRKAFIETNLSIHTRGQQNREFAGMGTTGTALVLRPEGAWVGHVGDSRVYRVRGSRIEQLSFDHSLVWELARRQRVSPDQLQGIPANVIVRSLGPEPLVQVDVEGPHPVHKGDTFVLCSDGLSGPLTDREIGAVVSTLPPAEACRFLVDLANLQGGPDNITVLVIRADYDSDPDPASGGGADGGRTAWLRWLPPPLPALFAGIVLALTAIALTLLQLPGGVPTFLLGALAIAAGLGGLFVQANEEKRGRTHPPQASQGKVHRQAACGIELPLLQKLARAEAVLQGRIRDRNWDADWDVYRRHRDLAERCMNDGELPDAFREYCRAMRPLTEALQRQRNKEEVFQPVWDKTTE
ncbi:MAG: serine/threonine-protein phosphatase [Gemmataceae bacterium]|nr:serine/threonine-protein phosphatase [Gemmataceae bacterium]